MGTNDRNYWSSVVKFTNKNMQRIGFLKMKLLKFLGIGLCLLLVLDSLVPIYILVSGFIDGRIVDEDRFYFAKNLAVRVLYVLLFSLIAIRLIKSSGKKNQ